MRDSVAVQHPAGREGRSAANEAVCDFIASLDSAKRADQPYRFWILKNCFPADSVDDILALPFDAPSLDGVSGKRELHNNTRKYFDVENRERFPVCDAIAQAYQDKRITNHIWSAAPISRVRAGHRRFLARAPHRSRSEGVHHAPLFQGSEPHRSRHRHL
jgi:hypothetical protein